MYNGNSAYSNGNSACCNSFGTGAADSLSSSAPASTLPLAFRLAMPIPVTLVSGI